MTNSQLIIDGFVNRGPNEARSYNFDLKESVSNFDLYEFFDNTIKDEIIDDVGAFLVVTDKQYVIGYNSGYGRGTHIGAFARVMKNLHGGGDILCSEEAYRLSKMCRANYITASIYCDYIGDTIYGTKAYTGNISFNFTNCPITNGSVKVFKQFCDDYKDDINYLIQTRRISKLSYSYRDNGVFIRNDTVSLDEILEFLNNNINNKERNCIKEEVIIGTEVNNIKRTLTI